MKNKLGLVVWPDKNLLYPVLKAVDTFDQSLKDLVADMTSVMMANGGVGIAAPQVGIDKTLFVVLLGTDSSKKDWKDKTPTVFANPELLELGDSKVNTTEGCLSFPGVRAHLRQVRSSEVLIRAQDITGAPFQEKFFLADAVVIAHEYDHLSGVTIMDHVGAVQKMMMKKKLKRFSSPRR